MADADTNVRGNLRTPAAVLPALSLLMMLPLDAGAVPRCTEWVAKAVGVQGTVEMKAEDDARWRPVALDQLFCGGETVRVFARSRAVFLLRQDDTNIQLDQDTTLTLPPAPSESARWMDLLKGAVHFLSRTPTSLKVKMPFLNAHIEGTEFMVRTREEESQVLVFSGKVRVENPAGHVVLESGQQAVAAANQPPRRYLLVQPRDAVAWALYYPPLIDWRPEALGEDLPAPLRAAVALYRAGRPAQALAALETLPPEQRDARYLQVYAGLLLAVGRSDDALPVIERAITRDPHDGVALALKSIVVLVRGDKEQAFRLAEAAAHADPRSPVTWVALSYAQQARFKLDDAMASVEKALDLAPQNALVNARLAELELSRGDLGAALEAAELATESDPGLSRTQTVLGFVHLAQINTAAARKAFEQAIRLDSSDPLARLGLGLAKIRQGDLDAGVSEIENAAILDPNNALVRSYLGKGYYEQKRDALAGAEYTTAKSLDPLDPTPWFYQAISEQTTNRPVEALQNLQKSIALNDNRAVYRSRLLLDDDLATRNTSLGRIYTDLGFQQLAMVESAKSLSLDPANHSAHRLLSDSYLGLSRHEIARGSELLQSRLLQPIASNPVRPSRSASDIRIAGSAGPADAGFNEFSPLFERNRVRLLASAFGGNHTTWGEETVLSALYDRYAVSLSQFHSDTEGFRPNNDLRQNAYDLFGQVSVTPALDIQTEYRFQDLERGDQRLNFDPDNFSDIVRQSITDESGRLGIHLRLSPHSDILVSALYGDIEDKRRFSETFDIGLIDPVIFKQEFLDDRSGYQFDAQYLFRTERFNLAAGGSVYRTEIDLRGRLELSGFPPSQFSDAFRRNQYSGYLNTHVDWPKDLLWTLGLSYDAFDERESHVNDALHPKLGLQWNITDGLHLRMAYFETLRPAVIVEQTLEPTEIAGFNQFFDDPAGTRARRYGIGIDTHLSENIYGGVELSRRDIVVPLLDVVGFVDPLPEEELREELHRVYLYWTPIHYVAASVEYRFDEFEIQEQQDFSPNRPILLETTRVPFKLRYFHPSGFFAGLGVNYVHQKIDLTPVASTFDSDRDEFVTIDTAIGFRFPKRLGIISLGVSNLLDESFRFQDDNFRAPIFTPISDPTTPVLATDLGTDTSFIPDRTLFVGVTLSF